MRNDNTEIILLKERGYTDMESVDGVVVDVDGGISHQIEIIRIQEQT